MPDRFGLWRGDDAPSLIAPVEDAANAEGKRLRGVPLALSRNFRFLLTGCRADCSPLSALIHPKRRRIVRLIVRPLRVVSWI
jgi:hypothetical protein